MQAPAGLLRQLWADLESDHLLRREGRSELPRAVTVERRDLNGDGRPEWWVVGTRVCGNANCPRWIYRQHADGRFQQVYDGAGVRIDVLPRRSSGWPALVSVGHMSAYEAVYRRSQWVGGRYVWVDTEYRGRSAAGADSLIYHLAMSNAGGRRRLVLDPVDAGGGLWVSATYDVCANGGLGGGCGAPELVLQSTRLPAGRVCVRFRAEDSEPRYATTSRQGWCGVTTAAPASAGRAGRRLVVQPTRREWAQLGAAYGLAFTGPGMPGRVETDAVGALMAFSWELRDVYSLPCVAEGDCRVTRR
ncbi:MAG TPA: hypothetical protein VFS20_31910 [Longimicrobium sp.]|nr:hypothetical protein [Longimicrobium sp.]